MTTVTPAVRPAKTAMSKSDRAVWAEKVARRVWKSPKVTAQMASQAVSRAQAARVQADDAQMMGSL